MGFWKIMFGGGLSDSDEEKRNEDERKFDLLKYDGVKALQMNQTDYAVKCFRETLKVKEDLETRDYLSQALIRLGRFDEALAELESMLSLTRQSPVISARMGHVAYMMEDYDRLEAIAHQAIEADAQNAHAYYMLAQASLGKESMAEAVAQLTQSLALDDAQENVHLLRAQTLMRMGAPANAADDAAWLAENAADEEDALMLLARFATMMGQNDEAENRFSQVIDQNPFNVDAYRERGRLRYERGDKQGAEEDVQKVLELCPEELDGVNGNYEAEGVEQMMKRAYTAINPFGL